MKIIYSLCALLALSELAGAQAVLDRIVDVTSPSTSSINQVSVNPGTWTPITDPGEGRELATVTLLSDGLVLVTGGEGYQGVLNLVELFDPATDTFSTAAPLQTQRDQATATLLMSGRVLVVGGTSNNVNAAPLVSAEIYDPATNTWTFTGSLHQPRKFGESENRGDTSRVGVPGTL